jgi:hypothetical protein
MVRARVALVLILGFILVAAGLAYYLTSTSAATLAIQIHDVPASWSHVTITFSQVAVHPANVANDSRWIVLNLTATQIDFLGPGNLTKLLALDRVAPGAYTQIRIIVASVQGVLVGGASVSMTVPDGSVKTATPFTLRGGATTTVTLDLDLSRSIHQAGGVWIFMPVLGQISVG